MNSSKKSKSGIEASLNSLTINDKKQKTREAAVVADSWEDDEGASSSASSDLDSATQTRLSSASMAPPPTPISPSVRSGDIMRGFLPTYNSPSGRSGSAAEAQLPSSRPEKSTAVAGRMIAGALGVKAPRKTEEARAYERAVREKQLEKNSRDREERRKEEERRRHALKQVWED